ncbi:MAG: TonB-dependent receptor [Paludibacter sp.]|nr:TonB-dependent receptor [Paludibacter sp.]
MRSALTFLFLLFVKTVLSQSEVKTATVDSVELNEVQVTAARYPQSLRSLAAPVQLISSNMLQRISTGDLSSALASVPGVQLQSGTFQTLKLTLRGIGSRSQYSTNRTRVYIDDIPLTGGDGTSVFDDLELSFLSRAEITKGSYSAWYGSGMGGSLRYVSQKASDKLFSADAGTTSGSFGLLKFLGMARSGFESGKLTVGLSHLSGDGYRQNSSYSRNSALLTGEFSDVKALGKITYLLMLSDVNAFTPSSVDENTSLNNPEAAAANWLNVKGFKAYQRLLAGVKIDTKLSRAWTNTLLLNTNAYDQYELRPFNILDDRSVTFSVQESVRFQTENANVAFGIEALTERYNWQTQANNTLEVLTDALENRSHINAFASTEWLASEKIRISLAANLNFTEYSLTENQVPDRPVTNGNYAGKAIFSPMAGVVYRLSEAVSLYGSAGHGFSNPTVEESLNSEGMMNTHLRPEQGWTFDAGAKCWFPEARIYLQGSAYLIALNDLLVTKRPAEDVFYGENAGSSMLKGLEMTFRQQAFDWLNYSISGSVSDNRFSSFSENNISYAGKNLPGIPQSQLYSDMEIILPWQIKFHTAFRYSGMQYADDANRVLVKGWKTLDAGVRYETKLLGKLHLNAQLAVNNLFNEHYASMILINAPSFNGRAPRYYYPALPRNFAFTLRLQWK